MKLGEVQKKLIGIPFTQPSKGAVLYNTIMDRKCRKCIELGFAHGVGTAYIAAAIDELGSGTVLALDREVSKKRNPRADELLASLGLDRWTELVFGESSYNWYLMKLLEKQEFEFDFCFIDGNHSWEVDGLAVLLVERILQPGGIIILDDLDWTYASSRTLADSPQLLRMPEAERITPQVRKIFDLLVKGNSAFSDDYEKDGWGFAVKRS